MRLEQNSTSQPHALVEELQNHHSKTSSSSSACGGGADAGATPAPAALDEVTCVRESSRSRSPGLVIIPSQPKGRERDADKRRDAAKKGKPEKDREREKDRDRDRDKDKDRTKDKEKEREKEKEKDKDHDQRGVFQGNSEGGFGSCERDRTRDRKRAQKDKPGRRDDVQDLADDQKDRFKEKSKEKDTKDARDSKEVKEVKEAKEAKDSDRKLSDSARWRRKRRSGSCSSNDSEARKQVRRRTPDRPAEKERRERSERSGRADKEKEKDKSKDKDKSSDKNRKEKRDDREHHKKKDVAETKDAKPARSSRWGSAEEVKDTTEQAAAQAAMLAAQAAQAAVDKANAEAAAAESKKHAEAVARKERAAAARRAAPPPPWMAAQALFKATPSSASTEVVGGSPEAADASGGKKKKLDFKDIGDLQRSLTEERNKLRLFIIKAKSEFEDRKEKDQGGAKDSGATCDQEYYNAKVGQEFGPDDRFKVEAAIGRGVFSSVYHCTDTKDGNTAVAIKFIRANTMMRKAAEKEVEIYKRIGKDGPKEDPEGSRHCINLAGVGTFDHCGHLCVVFELLKCDMRFALQKYGQGAGLPLPSVAQYARQLLLALRTLRKVGVIHADLKPDNILMTMNKAEIQICDFGSALDASEQVRTAYAQPRYYRAPDVILGVQYDSQIDVWSAGATIFELATGRILFTGKTNNQMLKQMIDVCGGFPLRMISEGEFSKKHFNSDGEFLNMDPDSITGEPDVIKAGPTTKPARPVLGLLQATLTVPAPSVTLPVHEKWVSQLADLVGKCLRVDPLERIEPVQAVELPFFRKDK